MKRCPKCDTIKDESEFYKNSRTKDKLTYWCKKCTAESSDNRYWRLKSQRHCSICGIEIIPNSQSGYCFSCMLEIKRLSSSKCAKCGKHLHNHKNKYCSNCYPSTIKRDKNPHWRGGETKIICQNCGEGFSFRLSPSITSKKYCSVKCATEARTGEKSPFWRGGTSLKPYPPEFNDKFKRMIRRRDGYICTICSKRAMDVHHIDYCKSSVLQMNCITLCRVCHLRTNGNRLYWEWRLTREIISRFSDDYC